MKTLGTNQEDYLFLFSYPWPTTQDLQTHAISTEWNINETKNKNVKQKLKRIMTKHYFKKSRI